VCRGVASLVVGAGGLHVFEEWYDGHVGEEGRKTRAHAEEREHEMLVGIRVRL